MSVIAIGKLLGGRKVLGRELRSTDELIAAVRRGLPSGSLDHVVETFDASHVTAADVYRTIGSVRTLQRKHAQRLPLTSGESDRLARLARMLIRAESALGNADRSRRWMTEANRALGDERPIDLLDSDAGTLSVEQVLARIEHGVYE
jgi:putative toxin-antitoxin system antitoxin component (TIGR02293 family)